MKSILYLLQAGLALSAVCVLQLHADILTERYNQTAGPEALSGLIDAGQFGVDFFFVLSGFIILHAHYDDPRTRSAASAYLRRRLIRIYVPYLPLALAIIAFYLSWPQAAADSRWSLFTSLTLIPTEAVPRPVLSVAWTLSHELLFYVLFAVSYFTRRFALLMVAWVAVMVAVAFYGMRNLQGALPDFTHGIVGVAFDPINIEFIIGMLAAIAVRVLPRSLAPEFIAAGTLCLILFFTPFGDGASRVWFAVAISFLVIGLVWLEMSATILVPVWLVFLGNASYAVYLVHGPAMSVGWRLASRYGITVPWSVGFLISCAIGLACGIAYHLLVERPLLSLARREGSARGRDAYQAGIDRQVR